MNEITKYIEQLLASTSLTGGWLSFVTLSMLFATVALIAWLVYLLCIKIVSPLAARITSHTDVVWDDYLFNPQIIRAACNIVPAIIVWMLMPPIFSDYPIIQSLILKATAIYITIATMRLATTFISSLKLFDNDNEKRSATQQYLHSFCGVLKIIVIFLGVIVIISIIIDRSPLTLLAGLGATSAVLMLVFKDTITGLVAGIRLTSNNMVRKGDWITVSKTGANGTVEDITLSTVKVRNFDNTIVTVPPQKLIEDSFQNWHGGKLGPTRHSRHIHRLPLYNHCFRRTQKDSCCRRLDEDGGDEWRRYQSYAVPPLHGALARTTRRRRHKRYIPYAPTRPHRKRSAHRDLLLPQAEGMEGLRTSSRRDNGVDVRPRAKVRTEDLPENLDIHISLLNTL